MYKHQRLSLEREKMTINIVMLVMFIYTQLDNFYLFFMYYFLQFAEIK